MKNEYKGRLKRLSPLFYHGKSYVHWTFTMQDRKTGWLTDAHHQVLRRILFQWLVRYHQCCPVYCLMPDHAHFVFVGLNDHADQMSLVRELSREWNHYLHPVSLSLQAYDNVLKEEDRAKDAFPDLIHYILQNPVRKELVSDWQAWPYSGAILPGYPNLDPRKDYFWENFWKGYRQQAD
jgi:REP element-mobilizing transposase RayT